MHKALNPVRIHAAASLFTALLAFLAVAAHAAPRSPLPPFPERALNTWRFDNPLAWGGPLSPPLALSGTRVEEAGSGYALRVGGALGPVLNRFPLFQSDGRPNLTLRSGTVRLWFAPDWSSGSTGGKGPGSFARLIEVGEVSEKAAGWWSLYFDPAGDAIHFSAQADGVSADYLKAPIAWQAGEWHQVTLIYAEKFSALYLDGELATVGEGVSVAPEEQAVAASGFVLGGDGWGASLAEGQFDELTTLDHPAGGMEILANYKWLGPVLQLGPVTSAETEFNRARSAAAKASKELQAGPSEEGGAMRMMAMLSSPCGTNLCLGIEVVDQYAVLTLFNTLPGTNYQIFSRADLYDHSLTNSALNSAVLEQELVGVEDQNYTQTVIPMSGRPWLFFRARETDRDIPHLHISDVRPPVLPEPYVQVRGYSESALASLTWTVTNNTGTTNGRGYILQQHYDTQQYKLTTNWWQCFDVPLGPGFNRIVITAADRQGNTNTTTLHYASVFDPNRAPPALVIDYPPADRQVAGTNFTLRGTLDNPTATVLAQVVMGGVTNRIAGLVERNGAFWIENLPLTPGTNALTLIATDAGGVAATNTLDVVGSAVSFSVDGIGGDGDLYKPVGVVGGTVASGYTVTVNGVVAEVFGGGYWQSNGVPIPRGGVAVFHAEAFPASGPVLVAELILDKPTRLFLSDVDREQVHAHDWTPCDFGSNASVNAVHLTNRLHWQHYGGGLLQHSLHRVYQCENGEALGIDSSGIEFWDAFGGYTNAGIDTPTILPKLYAEHASVEAVVAVTTIENGAKNGHHSLHSESQMHVQSGGRSIARRRDVIRFDGSGLEYFVTDDPLNTNNASFPGRWDWEFESSSPGYLTDITTNVTVLDGKLGPDGRLYSAIPAGAEIDCTPFAPGDYHRITLTAADATPRLDAGMDNGAGRPEKTLHLLEPAVANPGKVLFANTGDSNGDGVPDFADGYGLFGPATNNASRPFAPLVIDIPYTADTNRLRLTLAYDLSAPGGVTFGGNIDDGFTYTPPAGAIRLWTINGGEARTNSFIESGGNLVSPAASYGFSDLPFVDSGGAYRLTLYVESVRPSAVIGDQVVTLHFDADGPEGNFAFGQIDNVFFTSLDTVLVTVDYNGNTTPATKLDVSHPSPVVTVSACSVGNMRASPDYQTILGDLSLAGAIHSAVCDYTPGTNGTIDGVYVYVNSYDTPVAVLPVAAGKTTNTSSFLQPFPFTGAFSTNLLDVELGLGVNLIRVTAVDKVQGITGYAEYTVEVTGQKTNQLLQSYADAGVGLDFGSITALSQLTATNPVSLGFTNFAVSASYSGTLYKVSDTPLVLSNAQAWIAIPDSAALDAALAASGAARFDASMSVPALAPLNIGFTLERPTNSGPFAYQFVELQFTASGPLDGTTPDSIDAQLRKGGGSWQTATLTNSAGATNTFGNGIGTFVVELAYTPFLVATQIDELVVVVTNTALAIDGDVLGLSETATNSSVFATDPGLLFLDDDWRDWTFGGGNATALAASTGGTFHPYALQYQGPPALLDAITNIAVLDDQGQPTGNRRIVKNGEKHYLQSAAENAHTVALIFLNPVGETQNRYARIHNLNDAGQFVMGFGVGFYEGGVSLVEGVQSASAALLRVTEYGRIYTLLESFNGQKYKQDKAIMDMTLKALKPLLDFVLDIQTLQVNAALSASEGNYDEAVANLSDAGALVVSVVKEVVVYVQQYDATNTAYNRGRLQGRVMLEALSLVVGEIKLLQAGQITKITKTGLLGKLRNSAAVQGDAKALAAVTEAESYISRKSTVLTRLQALDRNYWQYGGGMTVEGARAATQAAGFKFELGRDSRFENARNAVIIGRQNMQNGQVNRVLLAEEIQHGLDRATREASRSKWRGLGLEAFHAELFERVLAGRAQGKYQFLTADDIAAIQRLIGDLNQ